MNRPLVKEHFHSVASYWKDVYSHDTFNGAMYRQRRAKVLSFVDRLNLPGGARVLDAGCGAGTISVALAKLGMRVEALDAVAEMVLLTEQAAREDGVADHVGVQQGDVHHIPFEGDWFDVAVAIGVMEWMPSFEKPLGEFHRVLRPGGWLIASVDNSRALHCLVDPRMNPVVSGAKRRLRRLAERAGWVAPLARPSRCSRSSFNRAIRHAGFERVDGLSCGFGPITLFGIPLLSDKLGLKVHHTLQRLSDRRFPLIRNGGETYLVLAKKKALDSASSTESAA